MSRDNARKHALIKPRYFVTALLVLFAGVVIWLLARPGDAPLSGDALVQPYSREAFDQWAIHHPQEHHEFSAMVEFLASKGVGNVVPAWQLTRTDTNRSRDCERPEFLVPPREQWPNIVPVLALVRDHVVPQVGAVEVQSSYRTTDFNACIGGASQSKHLSFSAVDLTPADKSLTNAELFRRLCALHASLGNASRFGLGAYFDPAEPGSASGRFHVDTSGYRSWGASQKAESSGCRAVPV